MGDEAETSALEVPFLDNSGYFPELSHVKV